MRAWFVSWITNPFRYTENPIQRIPNMIDRLIAQLSRPVPMRTLVLRKLLRKYKFGSFETRLRAGAVNRPNYAWCLFYAAQQARLLGYKAVTVIELGVAGGNGLVCLCELREEVMAALGVEIYLVGFDAGSGLPESSDP